MPELEVASPRRRGRSGPARRTAASTGSSATRSSSPDRGRRVPRARDVRVGGTATGRSRSELDRIADEGRVCVLELEIEGALRVQEEVERQRHALRRAPTCRARAAAARARDRELRRDRRADRARAGTSSSRPRASATWSGTTTSSAPPTRSQALVERELAARSYHGPSMIHPRIDELLPRTSTRATRSSSSPPSARGRSTTTTTSSARAWASRGSAAARRVALEELLDDVPGGDRPGQDQVRVRQAASAPPSRDRTACAGTMWPWRGSCSASPAASPPTRRASSCACSSGGPRGRAAADARRRAVRHAPRRSTRSLARPPSERSLPAPRARRPARRRAADGEHAREARARARRQRAHRGGARAPRAGRSSRRR